MNTPTYTVVIQWCPEDRQYVASLPEWGPYCKAFGATYVEAAEQARQVLELLMVEEGDPRPKPDPLHFAGHGADVIPLPDDGSPGVAETTATRHNELGHAAT